jgi:DNA end-binding protein Ku
MARPIWKGSVSFGLVTIPVGLYSAVERTAQLSFRQLHEKDGSPIDYKRFCAEEDVEVPWGEIVKGFEYEKGRYVVVTDEDFAKARVPATETFEIRDFVPAGSVGALYFDHPYYVAPAGKGGAKAYALLRDALKRTGRVGIGTLVLRQREHLAALHPLADALVLSMLRYANEIRPPSALDLPGEGEGYQKREMDLGLQLVESLAAEWDPEQYRDTYTEVLRDVIGKKVEGKEVTVAPDTKRPARVVNLVKALEQSLSAPARKAGARAAPRRAAARQKATRRRRAAA